MAFQPFQKLYISPNDVKEEKDLARVINSLQANVQDVVSPMVQKIQNDSLIIPNVNLIGPSQVNIINHALGRPLLGWVIIRIRASASVWDTQDSNPSPDKTLFLNASANVSVDLLVF